MHQALLECQDGPLAEGWGEVSYWPAERIGEGRLDTGSMEVNNACPLFDALRK